MKKKILLIAFKFPPYSGVGGFRWSKLCKYLARLGHEIHVVTVKWWNHGPDTFRLDVQHPNIYIHYTPSGYLHNLRHFSFNNRYLNAFKNRILFFPLDRVFFFDDHAQRWGQHLLPACEAILNQENIKLVISTGAPFQANRWAAVLKKKNSSIQLIQDFQDPWIDNPYRTWPKSKLSIIRSWQKMSIETADYVVAVTKGLLDLLLDDTNQKNGEVIYNGYDMIVSPVKDRRFSKKSDFSFAYIGTLGNGRVEPLAKFLEAVRQIKDQIPLIQITLVGDQRGIKYNFPDLVKDNILILKSFVPQEEAFRIVTQHQYAIQLNAKLFPYLVSTKIYEYGMLNTPTISFNYGGEIHDLIQDHSLGFSVNVETDNIAGFLVNLYQQPKKKFTFAVEKFSYQNLARKYSDLIERI